MSASNTEAVPPADVEALCRRAVAGDADALEQVLCLHHRRLMGFARRKIDPRWQGKIEPEDVLQESYVEAFASIPRFVYQGDDSFYRWMTRIIEHRFYNLVRGQQAGKRSAAREVRAGDRSSSGYNTLLDHCLREGRTPSLAMQRADAEGALLGCLARLPEDHRAVIRRRYLEEADFAAIAAELGRSEDAVRRLADRAIEKLEACMGRASNFLTRIG